MTQTLEESRAALLEAAAALADPSLVAQSSQLLHQCYRHTVTEDLLSRRPEDLLGAALSLRSLASRRNPGTPRVRVFTPTVEHDGWSCGHSVVEVVTDDMPFLVDSVTAEIGRQGRAVHLIVHPQMVVRREPSGELSELVDADVNQRPSGEGIAAESWMHIQVDRMSDQQDRARLAQRLERILADVRVAVQDWPAMTARARAVADELEHTPPAGIDAAEVADATSLLRWLADGQFTFLGYRRYDLRDDDVLQAEPETGLGLLRDSGEAAGDAAPLPPRVAQRARERTVLVVTKANAVATVHRPVYLDYVSVRRFDADGEVVGEDRFLGLFTASAYTWSVLDVPYVRSKVRAVLERSGFAPESHLAKDLLGALETYPRDELFQADVDTLHGTARAVVHQQERRKAAIFLRPDTYGRYMSCLVYIPRDRYTTAVRKRIEALLVEAFDGERVEYTTWVSDAPLARLHYVVRVADGHSLPEVDQSELDRRVVDLTRTWEEDLAGAARAEFGDERAAAVLTAYGRGIPEAYKEDYHPRVGVVDLRHLDELGDQRVMRLNLYQVPGAPGQERRLKLYRTSAVSLTRLLPVFTDMGVEVIDERPYEFHMASGQTRHIYDFGLRAPDEAAWMRDEEGIRERFQAAFEAVWSDQAESDGFNALVLRAGLTWREVVILRAVARYLRQTGLPFSNSYLESTLAANPQIARRLVELFAARFDPDAFGDGEADRSARDEAQEAIAASIETLLDDVASLDMDRILRAFLGVIQAAVRTNYYQRGTRIAIDPGEVADAAGEGPKPTLCFKLDPQRVPNLPQPRPMFEIWVYSPRVEGVHLRFGKVARGGLRWSDRREDFRTENLGLVKAQMAKNAVIVPTGSKGAFFPKRLPPVALDRDAWLAEGVAAYKLFISAMLDVTDNRQGGAVVPPERVVRHDGDDPYLVVAADKGTATFSDIANAVSRAYDYWLDDAFASGGSAGYDHKGMGITARGAWESVKRHFRELGRDTQTEDFTVVGIGDMSGDVFGNGMLLSQHIRLVAAFDHRHVFLDPDPDPLRSYQERRRLFDVPRSSWADYDATLISDGGGVYPRDAKSVRITEPVAALLGLDATVTTMTPAELIHAILLAPVDLIWNGGIGTYIKATTETHADIGDRANDAIRVNGGDLRAKVVGEGGNLGASQLGRIEAALAGVRVNTDAIDNSAGVDTSDHEVNIKILLNDVVREGDLTIKQRDRVLASMTDAVAHAVLRTNYEQNVLLGNARLAGLEMTTMHERLMTWLEDRGELDRALLFLPDEATLAARLTRGQGLTSPEFATLMPYAKLSIKSQLRGSGLTEDPWFATALRGYFPEPIREQFDAAIDGHPLREDIVINDVANSMVNRGGITFVYRVMEETGATPEQIAKAFVICREVFGMREFVAAVEATDNLVDPVVQTRMYLDFRRLMDRSVRWVLQNRPHTLDVGAEIARFSGPVAAHADGVADLVRGAEAQRLQTQQAELVAAGVPPELARRVAALLHTFAILDIIELAQESGADTESVAPLYFGISDEFGINRLLSQVSLLPREDRWDALARAAMRDDVYDVLESLVRVVMTTTDRDADADRRIGAWVAENPSAAQRARQARAGLEAVDRPTLAALSVALRSLRSIVRSGSASS
ncbi:MAG: NAD-glutamate dehydrogenase [Austwickia sp.]|nr:NAD-glutamate dehydrogenase [Austwickia sp.]MBK8435874.1 NAD-glutamate dehydrogenase [Austwickia sp.]MBK9101560.1 NAD-glutamate dehydrogenase [Austwickia sp.]